MSLFITGTDTDCGKTYVTALLLRAICQANRSAVGFKPFCCGSRDDALILHRAGDPSVSIDEINPFWWRMPAAPYVAAMVEGRPPDLPAVGARYVDLASRFDTVIVEGAGGWETPLAPGLTMADFAEGLGLPVLLVINSKLGALNHTILTAKNIRSRGLALAGLVLNHVAEEQDAASISHRSVLEELLEVEVLAELIHGAEDWEGDLPHWA